MVLVETAQDAHQGQAPVVEAPTGIEDPDPGLSPQVLMACCGMVALALGINTSCTSGRGLVDSLGHRDLEKDPEQR